MITPATMTPTPTTTTTTTPKINKRIRFIKNGINDDMVDVLIKAISVIIVSAEKGMTKSQLAKSIAYAVKEKWGDNGSWNVIVTSTPEGEEGDNVWGSFVNPVEHKFLKLHLGDHLYCEIWKTYSRTPETTTTPTTMTTPVTTTLETTMDIKIIKKLGGVTDYMVKFLKKTITDVVASAEEGASKTRLAKSIAYAVKEKWGDNGSWNVIVTSTPEGEEGDNVWGSFVIPVEHKYLKLHLGNHLYCEIWKIYSRTPAIMTTTTITPATTTIPATTTTPITTTTPEKTPATTKPLTIIFKTAEVTDEEVDFIKKTINDVVASAEEGTTKYQLVKSIFFAILKGKKGHWNVVIASTQSPSTNWSFFAYAVQHKLIKLQLGDNLYFDIWKAKK